MNNFLPKATPKEIQKSPFGYIMLLMAALLGTFVNWSINSQNKADLARTRTLEKTIEDYKTRDSIKDIKIEALQLRNDYLANIFIKKDSANRELLDKPVKDLLKQLKK